MRTSPDLLHLFATSALGLCVVACGPSDSRFSGNNKAKGAEGEIGPKLEVEKSSSIQLNRKLTQSLWLVADSQFENKFAPGGVFRGKKGCPTLKSDNSGSVVAWLLNQTDGYGNSSGCLPNHWSAHGSGHRSNSSMRQLIVNHLPGAGMSMTSKDFWGGRCRESKEIDGVGWPHFLFEQQFEQQSEQQSEQNFAKRFSQNQLIVGKRQILIHLDFQVHSVTRYPCDNYDRRKHAAQFLATIKLDHIHGSDDGIWIQLPIYDDRIAQTTEYFQDDQHGTPTFVIDQKKFRSSGSWHDGRRYGFVWNMKNEIQKGLDICHSRRDSEGNAKCKTNDPFKYKIHSVSVGWEVPGRFHVDSQLYFIGLETR